MLYLVWVSQNGDGSILVIFKIGLCSAISFKRSQRELSIDVAEHSSIMKNMGAMRILVIFQDRPMFSHIFQKVSGRAFYWCGWTSVYIEKWPKCALPPFKFHTRNRYSITRNRHSIPRNGGLFLLCKELIIFETFRKHQMPRIILKIAI